MLFYGVAAISIYIKKFVSYLYICKGILSPAGRLSILFIFMIFMTALGNTTNELAYPLGLYVGTKIYEGAFIKKARSKKQKALQIFLQTLFVTLSVWGLSLIPRS